MSRAELSPPPAFRHVNGYEGPRGLLELLIGEKLLANEAEVLGLHRDPAFQQWQRYAEGIAVGKELYREEVLSKVEIRESEVDSALALTQKSLQIEFFKSALREIDFQRAKSDLSDHLDDPLITFSGGHAADAGNRFANAGAR